MHVHVQVVAFCRTDAVCKIMVDDDLMTLTQWMRLTADGQNGARSMDGGGLFGMIDPGGG